MVIPLNLESKCVCSASQEIPRWKTKIRSILRSLFKDSSNSTITGHTIANSKPIPWVQWGRAYISYNYNIYQMTIVQGDTPGKISPIGMDAALIWVSWLISLLKFKSKLSIYLKLNFTMKTFSYQSKPLRCNKNNSMLWKSIGILFET